MEGSNEGFYNLNDEGSSYFILSVGVMKATCPDVEGRVFPTFCNQLEGIS